jgi:uncharacterized protein (TIGR03435 family)
VKQSRIAGWIWMVAVACGVAAQDVAPAFEVATVRENRSIDGGGIDVQPGGRYVATAMTLRRLIWDAYGIPMTRILGGPDWVGSRRFDVVARADGNPTRAQMRVMLQTLLRERFTLELRQETREDSGLALVVARARRLGPHLQPAAVNCSDPAVRASVPEFASNTQRPNCGVRTTPNSWRAGGSALNAFIDMLARVLGQPVVDRTELAGAFDIDLEWAAGPDDLGASIVSGLQEQLGLTLEPTRVSSDVLIIERADYPRESP